MQPSELKRSRTQHAKTGPQGLRTCHPKDATWVYWLFSAVGTWRRENAQRCFLQLPYLPKERASKTNLAVINSFPESFNNWGRLTYHRRGDWKSTQTSSQTLIPPTFSSRPLSFFLKSTHSLSKSSDLSPLSLWRWSTPEFFATWRSY